MYEFDIGTLKEAGSSVEARAAPCFFVTSVLLRSSEEEGGLGHLGLKFLLATTMLQHKLEVSE